MDALLTDQVVQAVGAVLATLVLIAGAWLAKLAKDKLGVEIDTARLTAVASAAEQGVLVAAQVHRAEKAEADASGDRGLKGSVNARMHRTAVAHVAAVAGKAARKAGGDVVDAAVQAAVRRLKGLL